MRRVEPIFSEQLQYDGNNVTVKILALVDEDLGFILLPIRLERGDEIMALGQVQATVSNPIHFGAMLTYAATAFASCLTVQTIKLVLELGPPEYEKSKNAHPDMTLGTRVLDIVSRMRERRPQLKDEILTAIKNCGIQATIEAVMGQ